jgi:hypothetical protein
MTVNYPPYPTRLVPSGSGPSTASGGEPYYPPRPGAAVAPAGGSQPGGFNRQKFIKDYANLVARTWADDTYLELILADPADTLAAAGLDTPEGAVFRIVQCKLTGMGTIDQQVDAWVEGYHTGLFDLFLPIKPDEVDVTAGGVDAEGGASCCCTPCCCCT